MSEPNETTPREWATCKQCDFSGHADKFSMSLSAYHDLRCPKCGTSAVDTSEINAAWKSRGDVYGYGDNNSLTLRDDKEGQP